MQVSREQVLEWIENPVTLVFKAVAEDYLENINGQRGLDCYCHGDPQKTQESMAQLNGEFIAWTEVIDSLEGMGEMDDEE